MKWHFFVTRHACTTHNHAGTRAGNKQEKNASHLTDTTLNWTQNWFWVNTETEFSWRLQQPTETHRTFHFPHVATSCLKKATGNKALRHKLIYATMVCDIFVNSLRTTSKSVRHTLRHFLTFTLFLFRSLKKTPIFLIIGSVMSYHLSRNKSKWP